MLVLGKHSCYLMLHSKFSLVFLFKLQRYSDQQKRMASKNSRVSDGPAEPPSRPDDALALLSQGARRVLCECP